MTNCICEILVGGGCSELMSSQICLDLIFPSWRNMTNSICEILGGGVGGGPNLCQAKCV